MSASIETELAADALLSAAEAALHAKDLTLEGQLRLSIELGSAIARYKRARRTDEQDAERQAKAWESERGANDSTMPECSICRRRHGREIVHACE